MEEKFGFILLNKPSGPTSHDMVDQLRRITGIRRIGHAGTLDPFASGLLIMAVGRTATREISSLVKMDKEYEAELRLGAVSDSHDRTGKISENLKAEKLDQSVILEALLKFVGPQKQIPPMHSAKKVGGHKLYELARKGIEIEREPSDIVIYSLELLSYQWPALKIRVHCSSGTYIRSLAYDIGQALGCGAYLNELKRTKIGSYELKKAHTIDELKNWQNFIFFPDSFANELS